MDLLDPFLNLHLTSNIKIAALFVLNLKLRSVSPPHFFFNSVQFLCIIDIDAAERLLVSLIGKLVLLAV